MIKNYTTVLLLMLLFSSSAGFAQDYIASIKSHLNTNRSNAALLAEDWEDFKLSNVVPTRHNGVTHVYAEQQINGIPIQNAIVNAAFRNGSIVYLSESLESNISERTNVSTPTLNPIQAASSAASALNLGGSNFEIQSALSTQEFVLNTGNVSLENVPVRLVYSVTEDGSLRLAWDLSIHTITREHWWSVRVDAVTGEIISKNDWILSCTFESHEHDNKIAKNSFSLDKSESPIGPFAGEQYNVFALPLESPNHGAQSLEIDPQDLTASPFGWHDTDGVEGAEFTITRGNNVWAQEDQNGNNGVGDAPDGGEELSFNFPIDDSQDASFFTDGATTNLFYWNNIIHDVFYQYGFDEAAGNFQQTNYTGEGLGNDFVFADSQDGAGINNATFGTPSDGASGVMTMFLWSTSGEDANVNIPSGAVAGDYPITFSTFSPNWPAGGLVGDLALVEDDDSGESEDPLDSCDVITNPEEIDGKIAVMRRGTCTFVLKLEAAQAAGAIGVIIVNNVAGAPINLGGNTDTVSIPGGMVEQSTGDAIIAALQNGEDITNVTITGGRRIDGSLDNGIIAHEYGHGISNRLTAGPSNVNCLFNDEQMGEGWSDYVGMMLTMREGDTAEQGRGVGTYAINQPITGGGIRPAPYSTDFSVNNLTYDDTNNAAAISQPHGIGTVWATMLWDMTWAFIDQYGFDDDIYNGTGGNNIALQLVIDGLKLQPCNPGFVTGRDAILAAVDVNDAFTTDQERRDAKCLVYTAFANRGVGFSATQGSPFSRTDQVEAFDFPEGEDNFCNPLSVADTAGINFQVFPNPSNGEININIGASRGEGTVKIVDINGRVVFTAQKALEGTVRVQAQGLATGVYLLQIQNDAVSQTTKIVIE